MSDINIDLNSMDINPMDFNINSEKGNNRGDNELPFFIHQHPTLGLFLPSISMFFSYDDVLGIQNMYAHESQKYNLTTDIGYLYKKKEWIIKSVYDTENYLLNYSRLIDPINQYKGLTSATSVRSANANEINADSQIFEATWRKNDFLDIGVFYEEITHVEDTDDGNKISTGDLNSTTLTLTNDTFSGIHLQYTIDKKEQSTEFPYVNLNGYESQIDIKHYFGNNSNDFTSYSMAGSKLYQTPFFAETGGNAVLLRRRN